MGQLFRVLGVGFGLAVILGNTIGAGILRTPGSIAAALGSEWLFISVWLAGGIYALIASFSMAELGAAIARAGGQYAFAHRALGAYAGFVVGWSDWISTCGSTAAVAIVTGEYTVRLLGLEPAYNLHIAAIVTVGFGLLQWRGVEWGSRAQELTAALKALAFIGLIAACFLLEPIPGTTAGKTLQGGVTLTSIVLALQAVIYTYDGWAGVVYFSEEVRDLRDIPRSLFGAVVAITAIYVLLNVGFLAVVPLEDIAGSAFAAGLVAERLLGVHGETAILVLTIISMLSCINAYHMMATRTLYGLGRDRLFSTRATEVNAGGTPSFSLFVSVLTATVFLLSGTFEQVVAVLSIFFVTNYTLSFISVFVLRWREPDLERPYRAFGYPVTTAFSLLGSLAFVLATAFGDRRAMLIAFGVLALSLPVYLLLGRRL